MSSLEKQRLPAGEKTDIPRLGFSPEEAGQIIGVSKVTVYRLLARRQLRCVAGIRHKIIPLVEIERFLSEGVTR